MLDSLLWRRRFCPTCANRSCVSNFSPCYTCEKGSNYCDIAGCMIVGGNTDESASNKEIGMETAMNTASDHPPCPFCGTMYGEGHRPGCYIGLKFDNDEWYLKDAHMRDEHRRSELDSAKSERSKLNG